MTRRARAGNTQKHQKQPENPTPWNEFVKQREMTKCSKKSTLSNRQDVKNINSQCTSTVPEKSLLDCAFDNNMEMYKTMQHMEEKCNDNVEVSGTVSNYEENSHKRKYVESFQTKSNDKINIIENKKKKKKKRFKNISSDDIKVLTNTTVHSSKNKIDICIKEEINESNINLQENNSLSSNPKDNFILNSPAKVSLKTVKQEKLKFLEQLNRKRGTNGILLLSPEIEKSISSMKKDLRNQGVPGENIREIIRKVRRKQELKFRKTFKTCFKCRKMGHVLSDCPLLSSSTEEGAGICFKCGSTEHMSSKCSIKTTEFPFAKCFVCHEQGHISRMCPKNKHGAYPKGGCCNLCGNINHLKKDCPILRKQKVEDKEEEFTIGTLTGNVEEIDQKSEPRELKFIPQKPKIVSF